jgi:hypothetical protein
METLEQRRLLTTTTLYVDQNATGANSGADWADAYTNLQYAFSTAKADGVSASNPVTIDVAQGTYKPSGGTGRFATFQLLNGETLEGGFAGAANPTAPQNTTAYPTILSGDIGTVGNNSDNCYNVVLCSGNTTTAAINGFTITAGNANGSGTYQGGAGIDVLGSALTITNCTFTADDGYYGGAIELDDSGAGSLTSTVEDCTFNGDSGLGAGIYEGYATGTIVNCAFINNQGDAINNVFASPNIVNCTFTGGTSAALVDSYTGGSKVTNCIFWANPGGEINDETGKTLVTYSDVQGGISGTGNINANPLFVNAAAGNVAIEPTSPCVNVGNNAAVPSYITTDLAGDPRIVGSAVDMGAYEATLSLAASAGGPYDAFPGSSITLQGSGSSSAPGALTYAWDFTGNGLFTDASGPNPTFTVPANDAPGTTIPIALRVTDSTSNSVVSTSDVLVLGPIVYVDFHATGANNGTSWANAFTNLQSALSTAVAGQTIDVAQGTYTPTAGSGRFATFQLLNGVTLQGGFAGVANPTAPQNISAYPTILSGDIGTVGNNSDNCYNVVLCSGNTTTAAINGFTITAGNANGSGTYQGGAGIDVLGSALTITNCTFTADDGYYGGAIELDDSVAGSLTSTVADCTFNGDSGLGAGIYEGYATGTIVNCAFINSQGDAINNVYSSPNIVNCTFTGGTSAALVDSYTGGSKVTNCILWANPGGEINDETGKTLVTYSDVQGGISGTGNINANPLFVNAAAGNVAIEPTSPCVNVGNNAAVPSGITADLAGNARIAGGTVDMGAYEALLTLTASTGGPYYALPGTSITLQASGSSPAPGPLTFAWDFTGNGLFTDASGPNPTYTVPAGDAAGTIIPIALRVTDSASNTVVTTTSVTVLSPIIYVDSHATGADNGTSWANAFTNLQSALTVAGVNQTVEVAQGTYTPTTGTNQLATFNLINGVTIEGGFAGVANPTAAQNISAYPTILSGDIGTIGNNSDNCYNVVTSTDNNATAVLNGVTITGGNANGSTGNEGSGGGLFINAGGPTITNCTFTANSGLYGGAMCVIDSGFSGVPAPTITDCTFTGNSAGISGDGAGGGAIYDASAIMTIVNCAFIDNVSTNYGGAIDSANSSPKIINCTFTGNSGAIGAAICDAFSLGSTLTNCILYGDTGSGEIVNNIDGSTTTTVTFSDVQGGYPGVGNINANPQFVNAAAGNFVLEPGSPCVNAGNNSAIPSGITTDLAGNPRIEGTAVDMGAYETQLPLAANAGGPYYALPGTTITLDGSGSSSAPGPLTYAWDFTGNGLFTDASGPNPTFTVPAGDAPGTSIPIALRVTDSASNSVVSTSSVIVLSPVVYVDSRATGSDNGTNWANAFTNLQSALAVAVSGQTIDVAEGTYTPTTGTNRMATFDVVNGLTIEGGFAGLADPTAAQNINAYTTILSGDIGVIGNNSDNSYNVMVVASGNNSVVLNGLTISGGNANDGSGNDDGGGGIRIDSGEVTVSNCTFAANNGNYGGAIEIARTGAGPVLTIANSMFSRNSGLGAGIYEGYSNANIVNCAFINNMGDAINNVYSSPDITNCTFTGNNGSAVVDSYSGGSIITNCILWGDSVSEISDQTGGTSVSFSDIQGGFTGTGNINASPQFINTAVGNVAIAPSSPCVNTGSNAAVPLGVTTDLAGNIRIAGGTVDMGAYETQSLAQLTWTGGGDGTSWGDPANWSANYVPNQFDSVNIPSGVAVQLGSGSFAVQSLTIFGNGTVDIGTGSLAVDYGVGNTSPLSQVQAYLASGAIFTSAAVANPHTAVGYADGSVDSGTAAQPGQVLLKYTLLGDTNLDGTVNFADLMAVSQNYNQGNTDWAHGNFLGQTYTGFSDLLLVIQNYNDSLTEA